VRAALYPAEGIFRLIGAIHTIMVFDSCLQIVGHVAKDSPATVILPLLLSAIFITVSVSLAHPSASQHHVLTHLHAYHSPSVCETCACDPAAYLVQFYCLSPAAGWVCGDYQGP
jgi:hypothetical protein